jgi:hypothetical protein
MPTACHPDRIATPARSGWVAIVLAFFLVMAQALALVHQFDHPATGADSECPLCIGGHGLDQLAVPQATEPAPGAVKNSLSDPGTLPERATTVCFARARDPPALPPA